MTRTHCLRIAVAALIVVGLAATASVHAQSPGTGPQPVTEADALAIYRARLAEQQANNEANVAAASAGYRQALTGARQGALSDQLEMVADAVRKWKAPLGYAGAAALDPAAIQDPFAPPASPTTKLAELQAAIAGSGLVLDPRRQIARVGPEVFRLCGGRLQTGDYPAFEDGNLLDTPARIAEFLSACGDGSRPLVVVVEDGRIEVRQ